MPQHYDRERLVEKARHKGRVEQAARERGAYGKSMTEHMGGEKPKPKPKSKIERPSRQSKPKPKPKPKPEAFMPSITDEQIRADIAEAGGTQAFDMWKLTAHVAAKTSNFPMELQKARDAMFSQERQSEQRFRQTVPPVTPLNLGFKEVRDPQFYSKPMRELIEVKGTKRAHHTRQLAVSGPLQKRYRDRIMEEVIRD